MSPVETQTRSRTVGRALPTRGAVEVATGELRYLTDLHFPDMLHGKIVRSPLPHALIRGLAADEARAIRGVVAVVTARDVPVRNSTGFVLQDQPVLAEGRVRHVGEPVAIVIAETLAAAEQGALAARVDLEPLPVLDDPEAGLAPGAPSLHEAGNLLATFDFSKGDIERALAEADLVIERTVITPCQEHVCLEPGGGVSRYHDGVLTVWCGTQYPDHHRQEIAAVLGLETSDVRVVSTPMGGAFGSKGDGPFPIQLALAAWITRRPVSIVLSREEVIAAAPKRHPFRITTRLGVSSAGQLLALDTDVLADTGAYASAGPVVLKVAAEMSTGPYRIANARFHGRLAYTNNGISGAFRGFGVPQVGFAIESALDVAARRLGLDPVELRRRNVLHTGDEQGLYSHTIESSLRAAEVLEAVAVHPWWTERERWQQEGSDSWRRGTGFALGMKGVGMGSGRGDVATARLAIGYDGSVRIWAGPNHSGQFIETAYAQIAADALGRDYDDIEVIVGDTELVAPSGGCGASRSTYAGGAAVKQACEDLLEAIRALGMEEPIDWQEAGRRLGAVGKALVESSFVVPDVRDLGLLDAGSLDKYSPHHVYGSAAQVARVEVNVRTGELKVKAVACAVDCGVAVNPAGVIGQTEGGIMQGMGFAVMEEHLFRDSVPQTKSLETYLIPTIGDAPEIDTILVEDDELSGPFGAKGMAEVVVVPTAPAIVAAIRDAVGVEVKQLPATPERLYGLMAGSSV